MSGVPPRADASAPAPSGRREEVLTAALKVFAARGYHGATIAHIVDQIGFTRAALYYYFDSKLELLDALAFRPIKMLLESGEKIASEVAPPNEKLAAIVSSHFRLMALNPDLFNVMIREQMELPPSRVRALRQLDRQYQRLIASVIRDGIDNGQFREVDANLAALHILGALNWMLQWYRPDGRLGLDEVVTTFVDLALSGLGVRSSS